MPFNDELRQRSHSAMRAVRSAPPARPAPSLAAARAEGRAAAAREAQEIAALCIAAGRPEALGQLIGRSPDQVRAALSAPPVPVASDPVSGLVAYMNSLS